mgnify:CR=1 FL=1
MNGYRVKAGNTLMLTRCDPDDSGAYKKTDQGKEQAKALTGQLISRLETLQERLYANGNRAVLIMLQGMLRKILNVFQQIRLLFFGPRTTMMVVDRSPQ